MDWVLDESGNSQSSTLFADNPVYCRSSFIDGGGGKREKKIIQMLAAAGELSASVHAVPHVPLPLQEVSELQYFILIGRGEADWTPE